MLDSASRLSVEIRSDYIARAARAYFLAALVSARKTQLQLLAVVGGVAACLVASSLLGWGHSVLLIALAAGLAIFFWLLLRNTHHAIRAQYLESYPIGGTLTVTYAADSVTLVSGASLQDTRRYADLDRIVARADVVHLRGRGIFWVLPAQVCPPDVQHWLSRKVGRAARRASERGTGQPDAR